MFAAVAHYLVRFPNLEADSCKHERRLCDEKVMNNDAVTAVAVAVHTTSIESISRSAAITN